MNHTAQWLAVLTLAAPFTAAVIGLLLMFRKKEWPRSGPIAASLGMLTGCVAAVGLAVLLTIDPTETREISCALGNSGGWASGASLAFGLKVDLNASLWIATVSALAAGLAWPSNSRGGVHGNENRGSAGRAPFAMPRSTPDRTCSTFAVTLALLLVTTVGLVISSSLLQVAICWMLIPVLALGLVGSSSSLGSAAHGMLRAIQIGLVGDLALLGCVLLIVQVTGTDAVVDAFSPRGLQRLGSDPALPGLLGCLLVVPLLGRSGLFPLFGWHGAASEWKGDLGSVIYGIAFVPSAIWLGIRFWPLMASSEFPLLLLGVTGTLGAVLGMLVACQQADPYRRLAYLISSQVGVVFAGLGSGRPDAVPAGTWHVGSLSIATVVLFLSLEGGGLLRHRARFQTWLRSGAVACAAFSIAGFFPGFGGWTQRAMIEVNMQPVSWDDTVAADDEEGGAKTKQSDGPATTKGSPYGQPRWGWIGGLWLVQGLTAFSAMQVLVSAMQRDGAPMGRPMLIEAAAVLLVIGGPCTLLLGRIPLPDTTGQFLRFAIGQAIAFVGLVAGSRFAGDGQFGSARSTPAMSPWELRIRTPLDRIQQLFLTNGLERTATRLIERGLAWVGYHAESLHPGLVEFQIVLQLVGTSVLLLTLFLIGR